MLELCLRHAISTPQLISINGAIMPLEGVAGYLFSPLAKVSANSRWMPRLFAYRARNPRNIKKLLDSTGSVVDPHSFEIYSQLFCDQTHVSGVLRFMANWQLETLLPRLCRVNQSVLLIAADGDRTIALRDSYRLLPHLKNARLSVIQGKGHLVHEEDPSNIAQQIVQQWDSESSSFDSGPARIV